MFRYALQTCLVLSLLGAGCGGDDEPPPRTRAVAVDWSDLRQPISGFGASSAWTANDIPDALADQLFSVEHGVGLSFLRVRITPSGTSAELPTARKALARGARVWAAPWSPPAAWKVGARPANGDWGGRLLVEHYPGWAESLANFVQTTVAEGVPLFGLSIQNEPGYVNEWETCDWTPEELTTFTRDHLIPALSARGLDVPLIAPESPNWNRLPEYAEPLLADPITRAAIRFVATHAYAGTPFHYETAALHGKELWQTEISEKLSAGLDPGIRSALWVARMMHDALTAANVSAWHYWWLIPRGDVPERDNGALLSMGDVTRRAYVMGNYSKFVRPGARRLGTSTANPGQGVFVTAYQSAEQDRLVIVAVNASEGAVRQRFDLSGVSVGEVVPWITSDTRALEAQPPLDAAGSSIEYELSPLSVTTLVGTVQ